MRINKYQEEASKFSQYPNCSVEGNPTNFIYPALGLAGEAGEVTEVIKKIVRDNNGTPTEDQKFLLKRELGDVLWYLAALCTELGFDLEDIAEKNIIKLQDRQDRNVINGSGDSR